MQSYDFIDAMKYTYDRKKTQHCWLLWRQTDPFKYYEGCELKWYLMGKKTGWHVDFKMCSLYTLGGKKRKYNWSTRGVKTINPASQFLPAPPPSSVPLPKRSNVWINVVSSVTYFSQQPIRNQVKWCADGKEKGGRNNFAHLWATPKAFKQ